MCSSESLSCIHIYSHHFRKCKKTAIKHIVVHLKKGQILIKNYLNTMLLTLRITIFQFVVLQMGPRTNDSFKALHPHSKLCRCCE